MKTTMKGIGENEQEESEEEEEEEEEELAGEENG
jgi:hypothetical protein